MFSVHDGKPAVLGYQLQTAIGMLNGGGSMSGLLRRRLEAAEGDDDRERNAKPYPRQMGLQAIHQRTSGEFESNSAATPAASAPRPAGR